MARGTMRVTLTGSDEESQVTVAPADCLAVATVVLVAVARVPMAAWRVHEPAAQYAYYRIQAADWIRGNTAASDRIGSWNAGTFGYFSHRTVVNLDGLVNDVHYLQRVLERNDLEG
jgi:hypothetical protein